MSRSGYTEDCDDPLACGRAKAAVNSAMRGRRGQAFLKELLAALDALPEKRLIREDLEAPATGMPLKERHDVCALGAVGRARGLDMSNLDPHDHDTIAARFGIAHMMACEIMYWNDDNYRLETPERRFERMRKWIADQIVSEQPPEA